jgi:hypothetical protein
VCVEGKYQIEGDSKFLSGNIKLLKRRRVKETNKKPSNFLLVDLGEGYEYLSSLYKIGKDRYIFDTGNKSLKYKLNKGLYELIIKKDIAIIRRKDNEQIHSHSKN